MPARSIVTQLQLNSACHRLTPFRISFEKRSEENRGRMENGSILPRSVYNSWNRRQMLDFWAEQYKSRHFWYFLRC